MKSAGTPIARGNLKVVASQRERMAKCTVGVWENATKTEAKVFLTIGAEAIKMSPDQAEQLAADLMQYVHEVRNGGRLA